MTYTGLEPNTAPCTLHGHFPYGRGSSVFYNYIRSFSVKHSRSDLFYLIHPEKCGSEEIIDCSVVSLVVFQKQWPCLLATLTWANPPRTSSTKDMVRILDRVELEVKLLMSFFFINNK